MPVARDLTGQRFGMLTAISPTSERVDNKVVWLWNCDCGSTKAISGRSVTSGNTRSCGCATAALTREATAHTRVLKECQHCRRLFYVKRSHPDEGTYCSKPCMAAGYRTRLVGDANPNWKGGIASDFEHVRARAAKYRRAVPEKIAQHNRNSRAARKKAAGKHTAEDISALLQRQDGRCAACGVGMQDDYHIDHIIPIARGGTNFVGNLQVLCPPCNLTKRTMLPIEHRVYVLKGAKEDAEQARIMAWASANVGTYRELAYLMHIPNGGHRTKKAAAKMQALGVKRGVPDLNLSVARGGHHGLYIELKVGRNKPTSEQAAWLSALRHNGYRAEVCVGFEAARDLIVEYLGGRRC